MRAPKVSACRLLARSDIQGMSEVGPVYPQLRTFRQRCLLFARSLPLYAQLRTWQASPANVSESLSVEAQ